MALDPNVALEEQIKDAVAEAEKQIADEVSKTTHGAVSSKVFIRDSRCSHIHMCDGYNGLHFW